MLMEGWISWQYLVDLGFARYEITEAIRFGWLTPYGSKTKPKYDTGFFHPEEVRDFQYYIKGRLPSLIDTPMKLLKWLELTSLQETEA